MFLYYTRNNTRHASPHSVYDEETHDPHDACPHSRIVNAWWQKIRLYGHTYMNAKCKGQKERIRSTYRANQRREQTHTIISTRLHTTQSYLHAYIPIYMHNPTKLSDLYRKTRKPIPTNQPNPRYTQTPTT